MRRSFPLFVLGAALLVSNLPAQTGPVVKTWKGGWFETNVASVWLDAWGWEPWGEPEQGHGALLNLPGSTLFYATLKNPQPLLKSVIIDAEAPGTGLSMVVPATGFPVLRSEDVVIGAEHIGWVSQAFGAMEVSHDLVLGSGAGSDGKYSLTVGVLSVGNNEIVGGSGTGQVDQSGAGNEIAGELVLGLATGGKGTYNNNAGWTTIGVDATVGCAGTGVLSQTLGGGTSIGRDLVLGREPGSSGEVSIMGLGAWTVGRHLIIGNAGAGTLSTGVPQTQEIGGDLVLGNRPGSRGILNLYAGGLNTKGQFIVGRAGFGRVLHILGKATLNSDLVLGQESSGQGDWMSTGETDVPGNAIIGLAGQGSYAQTAGWNRISGNLVLGQAAGSFGTYSLSALGFLEVAGNLVVGGRGTGSFSVMNIDIDSFAVKVGGSIILAESPGSTGVFGTSFALITAPRLVINSGGSFENSGGGTISEFYFDTVEQNGGRFSSIDLNISAPITNANYVTHYTLSAGELNVTGLGPLPGLAISDGGVLTQTGGRILGAGAMQSGGEINGAFEIRNKLLKSGGLLAGATRNLGVTAQPTEPQGFLQSAGRTEGTFDNQGDALIADGIMDAVIQNSGRFVQTGGLVQGTLHNQGYAALSEGVLGAVVYNSGALQQLGGRMTNTLVNSGVFTYSAGEFAGDFIQASTEGLLFNNLFRVGGDFRNEGVMTLKPIPQRLEVLGPNGLENSGTFGLLGGDLYTAQTRVGTTRDATFGHGSGLHQVTGTLSLGSPLGHTRAVYTMAGGDLSAGALDIRPGGVFTLTDGRVAVSSALDNNGVVVQNGGDVQTGETRIGPAAGSLFTQSAGTHRIAGALSLGGAANAGATNWLLGGQLSAAALELHSGGVFQYVNGTLSFDQVRQDGGLYQGLTVAIGNNQPIRNYFLTGGAVDALSVTVLPGGELSQSGGSLPNVQQNGGTIRGTLENNKGFTYAAGAFEGTLLNRGAVWLQAPFTAGNGWRNEAPFDLAAGQALTLNGLGLINESTFTLAGTLLATNETIGQSIAGAGLVQLGGVNQVQSTLTLGGEMAGTGAYDLRAGLLTADTIRIEPGGAFTQQGGSAQARSSLSINGTTESSGHYDLQDGSLLAAALVLTNGGAFEQTGGSNAISRVQFAQGPLVNRYSLQDGACAVDTLDLQAGYFEQSGGWLRVTNFSLPWGHQYQSFVQTGGRFQAEEVQQGDGWVNLPRLAVGPLDQSSNNVHSYWLGAAGLRAGSLELNEGSQFIQMASAVLEVPYIKQSGGSNFISVLSLGGSAPLPVTNLTVSGGTLDLDILDLKSRGTFTQNGGVVHARQFNQQGGTFAGTFQNTGTFNYSAGEFKGRLDNRGSVNWTGDLTLEDGLENHAPLTLNYGQHLTLNGRGLDNRSTIVLNWGGRIDGAGQANLEANSGIFQWNGGIVDGAISVGPGGTLYLAGSGNKQSFGPVINAGNAIWEDAAYYGNTNALLDNRGTLTLQGGGYFNSYYGIMTFNNSGLFRKTSGTITEVNAVFNNSGIVEVLGGRLLLNNGGTDSGEFFVDTNALVAFAADIHQLQAGARLTGPAGLFLVGDGPRYAALDVPEGSTLPVDGNLALHYPGALTGQGTVAVSGGQFEWSGGAIRCAVEVSPEPGTLVINGANNKQISGALLNRGSGVWLDGNIYPEKGSRFENSGTFTIQCDRMVTRYYDILDLYNTGVLRKTGSPGQTDLSASLLNEGLVAADTGVLSFRAGGTNRGELHVGTNAYIALDSGAFIFEPSARLSGPGWLLVRSQEAYASLGAPAGQEVTLEGNVQLANGGLSSGGSLLVTNGSFLWDSGVIYPTLKIAPENGRLLLANSGNKQLAPGARIENRGLIVWSGGDIYGDEEAVLRNEGVWQITGDAAFESYYGYLAIENAGELIKTNSPGTCDVSAALNNTGLVRVDSGCLYLSGPVVQMTNYALTGGRWYSRSPGYIATESSMRLFRNEADVTLAGPGTLFTGLSWLADNPGSLALIEGQQFATRTSLACFGSLRVDAASKLTVNGPFGLADTTTLDLEVGGPSAPIVVTEQVQLVGKLVVRLAAGLNPQASNTFTLIQHGSISGQFQNAPHGRRIATADRTGSFRITYGATAVELSDFRPAVVDIDGDAIADDWALRFFGATPLADGTGPRDKFGDQDGDGMTNYQEYLAGTNPTDSKSVLRLKIQSAESDALALEVSPAPDKIYRLWQSTNLAFWTECTNPAPLLMSSGALRWTLPAPLPPANEVRHFRLSVEE